MKKCISCQKYKSLEKFGPNKTKEDKRQDYCKPCMKAANRRSYESNKDAWFERAKQRDIELDLLINGYKSVPCADCHKKYPPYVMDFDHLDGSDKEYNISHMRRRRMAFHKIIEEIKKCEVVCANCHRERSNKRNPARWLKLDQKLPSAT